MGEVKPELMVLASEGNWRIVQETNGKFVWEERVEDATRELKVGDEIEAKFISLDRKNRTLSLSIRAKDDAEIAEALKEYKQGSATGGTTSLGDLLKEQLEQES